MPEIGPEAIAKPGPTALYALGSRRTCGYARISLSSVTSDPCNSSIMASRSIVTRNITARSSPHPLPFRRVSASLPGAPNDESRWPLGPRPRKGTLPFLILAFTSLAVPAPGRGAERPARDTGRRFNVPPGFVVEKVAGPPLVRYPLFVCFDDRGRMYVAEGTGTDSSRLGAEKAQQGSSAASCCWKTKTATAISTPPAGCLPTSWCFRRGCALARRRPYMALPIRASGGWGRHRRRRRGPGRREELLTGPFKFNGNGCDVHGPFLGPDGRG